MKYTKATRLEWLKANLDRFENLGMSHREIAAEMKAQFGLAQPPSPSTIMRALAQARDPGVQEYSPEAMELLKPENFPAFRKLFPAPNGAPYQTNKTHHALHWVIYSLTRKVDLPDWVIEFFEFPPNINEDIVEKEKLLTFVLLLAPRHGKTMTVIHSLIALIAESPNVRIIYSQGIQQTTQKIMSLIMSEMEHNDKLRELYGPFEDSGRAWGDHGKMWSRTDGFIVARRTVHTITPTFMPAGINVNVRSLDADIIIIDDPQDKDRAESEAITQKDYEKITTEFMTRREPHTPVLMIGSHLPTLHGDVFSQLEDNLESLQTEGQTVIMRKRPAHNLDICEGGDEHWDCLEWPEMRDMNFLMAQKALLGDELFEAVYQQESRIPGTRPFPPELVKNERGDEIRGIIDPSRSWKEQAPKCPRCAEDGKQGKLYTTLGFDPAAGEGKKASFSALAVLDGCIRCETIYMIDYWQKRQSPELHAALIASYAASFDVMFVRVETNAYQKALARDDTLRAAARKHRFQIDEWNTDDRKNTPDFGIPNLARWMRDDKFSIPGATAVDRQYYQELRDAFVRYPKPPNDLPMAVWLAAGAMWMVWAMFEDNAPIHLPGWDDLPEYMKNNPDNRVDLSKVRPDDWE